MKIFDRLFRREARAINSNSPDFGNWLSRLFGDFWTTNTGVAVTSQTALRFPAYYACVSHISRVVSKIPMLMYQRSANGARERATNHPLYQLLHLRPNPEQTPAVFKQYMQSCLCGRGNAYAEIQRDGTGTAVALWPLPPDTIRPERDKEGMLVYKFRPSASSDEYTLFPMDVLHLHGMGDGLVGYSPIELFKESIGIGLAAEKAGASLYKNGIRPTGVLEFDKVFKDADALERMRKQFEERYGGSQNTGRPLVLEAGLKWVPITMSLSDAQFMETRVHQLREMAMIFHLPPHLIGDLERATFSNIEESNISVVGDCYEPWLVLWEQECNFKLLRPAEQQKYFFEFLLDSLLRGNTESRYRAYQLGINSGFMTRNEVRQKENLPPMPEAEPLIMAVNYAPLGKDGKQIPNTPPAPAQKPGSLPDDEPEEDIDEAHRSLLLDVCARIVRMQGGALLKARKHADTIQQALDEVFDASHAARVLSMLEMPARASCPAKNGELQGILADFANDYTNKCKNATVSERCEPPMSAETVAQLLIEKLTARAAVEGDTNA